MLKIEQNILVLKNRRSSLNDLYLESTLTPFQPPINPLKKNQRPYKPRSLIVSLPINIVFLLSHLSSIGSDPFSLSLPVSCSATVSFFLPDGLIFYCLQKKKEPFLESPFSLNEQLFMHVQCRHPIIIMDHRKG